MVYDSKQIMKLLPHRFPFLLVDCVEELEEGKTILGKKCVTFNEPFFTGHFPDNPVMPGVLIIEALAQVSGMIQPQELQGSMAYLAAVNHAKFKRKVLPGDVLILKSTLVKQKGSIVVCAAEALVDGKTAAVAEITLSVQ